MYLDVTAPLSVLGLPRSSLPGDTRLEFERIVAFAADVSSLVVSGDDTEAAAALVRESEFVDSASCVAETAEGIVYRLAWGAESPALIEDVRDVDGTVLAAAAAGDEWSFELRFPDHDAASRFYAGYDRSTDPITIENVSRASPPRDGDVGPLTPAQREALSHAIERGYFEVPRRISLLALAEELDISDQALSERLRRGLANLLTDTALAPAGESSRNPENN